LLVGYDKNGRKTSTKVMGQVSAPETVAPPVPSDEGTVFTDSARNTWLIDYTWNSDGKTWDKHFIPISAAPKGMTEAEKEQLRLLKERLDWDKQQAIKQQELEDLKRKDEQERLYAQLQAKASEQQRQFDWEKQQQQIQLAAEAQQQQEQLAAAKQQQLASLAANPASWLEYATLSGTPPVVQPWMLPLGYEDYGFQLGQAIPGWGQELPELKTPSAQYLARLTPSQLQQYYAYIRARTGMTPEDVQAKLWGTTAPGGGYGGLRWLTQMR